MTGFIPFADSMGIDSKNIPADPKVFQLVTLYATESGHEGGSGDFIAASLAEVQRFRSKGVGVILIDQTPELKVLAAGVAHVGIVSIGDVEPGAGTLLAAAEAVIERQGRGERTTIYISRGQLDALLKTFGQFPAIVRQMVGFGVADWSMNRTEAEQYILANSDVDYVQWASPSSNPLTIEPGTNMDLKVANVDLDIARDTWAMRFIPKPPTPRPGPVPAVVQVPLWELHQGVSGFPYAPQIQDVQLLLNHHGSHLVTDGVFGPLTVEAVSAFQQAHMLPANGIMTEETWRLLLR